LPQYIHAFVPGGTFFFSVTLLERRRKLLTEIRTGIYNLEWAQMITFEVQGWDNSKGGMRFAFPPYGLRAKDLGLKLNCHSGYSGYFDYH
jgi:hypothetical protein